MATAGNGTLGFVIGKGVGAFIKTNNGWFKPQSLMSFFTKSYGQKIMQQVVTEGAINSTTVSFLKNGTANIKLIQQLFAIEEDGILGPKTQGMIKNLQTQLGVTSDGIWGQQTDGAFGRYLEENVAFAAVN